MLNHRLRVFTVVVCMQAVSLHKTLCGLDSRLMIRPSIGSIPEVPQLNSHERTTDRLSRRTCAAFYNSHHYYVLAPINLHVMHLITRQVKLTHTHTHTYAYAKWQVDSVSTFSRYPDGNPQLTCQTSTRCNKCPSGDPRYQVIPHLIDMNRRQLKADV